MLLGSGPSPRRHSLALPGGTRNNNGTNRRASIQDSLALFTANLRLAKRRASRDSIEFGDSLVVDKMVLQASLATHYSEADLKVSKIIFKCSTLLEDGGEQQELEVWLKRKGVKQRMDFLARLVEQEDKEAKHYRETVQSLRAYVSSKSSLSDPLVLPLPHHFPITAEGMDKVFLVEQLAHRGYREQVLGERQQALRGLRGLDYEHSVLAIAALARFHGTSYCQREECGGPPPGLSSSPPPAPLAKATLDTLQTLLTTKVCPAQQSSLLLAVCRGEKGKQDKQDKQEQGREGREGREGRDTFGVMCHGNFRTDSLRFKYRSELESRMFCSDVVFQDLSRSHYGSCVLDLLQFLFTSVDPDVRSSFMADFVCSVYYENFAKAVGNLNPETRLFTKKAFIREVYHKMLLSLPFCVNHFSPLLEEEEEGEAVFNTAVVRAVGDIIQFRANIRATIS